MSLVTQLRQNAAAHRRREKTQGNGKVAGVAEGSEHSHGAGRLGEPRTFAATKKQPIQKMQKKKRR